LVAKTSIKLYQKCCGFVAVLAKYVFQVFTPISRKNEQIMTPKIQLVDTKGIPSIPDILAQKLNIWKLDTHRKMTPSNLIYSFAA